MIFGCQCWIAGRLGVMAVSIADWDREQELIGLGIAAGAAFLVLMAPAIGFDLRNAFVRGVRTGVEAGTDQTVMTACKSLGAGGNLRTAVLRQLAAYGYGTGL